MLPRNQCTLIRTLPVAVALLAGGVAWAQWDPNNGEWYKSDPNDLRVMTWNLQDGIRTEAAKSNSVSGWNGIVRIVAGLQPDILILQETADNGCGGCVDTVSELETVFELLFHGGADPFEGGTVGVFVQMFAPGYDLPYVFVNPVNDGFNRNVILSRYPFLDLNGDGSATESDFFVLADEYAPTGSVIRGHMFAEIDLPDAVYEGDVVVGNAHFKAGGSSSDFAQRLQEAQVSAYFIDYAFNGGGVGLPDPNNKILFPNPTMTLDDETPVIWGGDWNEDEQNNGRKGPAEWITRAEFTGGTDGTDRDRSDSTYDDARDFFNNNRGTRNNTKLDYLAWQDSVIEGITREFIFDSSSVPGVAQLPEPVRTFPSVPDLTSIFASDHKPVVIDIQLPLSTAGPCNLADLAAPFGVLDLTDINSFTVGFITLDPIADLNTNGVFDLTDINLFINNFVNGCP